MRLSKSFKLALNVLLHSKLRSWLTILGIVIGVAAIVAIVSIGQGAQQNVQERLGGLGADIITVSPGFNRASGGGFGGGRSGGGGSTQVNLTDKDLRAIKSVDGVAFVNGMVTGRADTNYLTETASLSIRGVDPLAWSNIQSATADIESGRYLNPGDANVVVLGNQVATKTFKQPVALNRMILIGNSSFKVVGILAPSSNGADDNVIFMPVVPARNLLQNYGRNDPDKNKYDTITVKVVDPNTIDQVSNDMAVKLRNQRHVTNRTQDFTVTSAAAQQQRLASVTQTFTVFLAAIAAVSLLVGAVGIANTMFTSVLEKTREIGIMKAIGAKNSDIMTIFLLNSGLVGFVGGLLGIGLGAIVSMILPNLFNISLGPGGRVTTVIPLNLLIAALVGSVLIGMLAGAIPAYRASKLPPVDALRSE